MDEHRAQVRSIRGRASIKIVSTRENLRAQCLVFVQKPDKVRLEIVNPMNIPLFLFVNSGREWINYSFEENRYLRGDSEESAPLLGLTVKDIISFVSGQVPLLPYDTEEVSCAPDGKYTLLTFVSEEGREKIWITPEGDRIVRGEIYDPFGELRLKVGFKEFQNQSDVLFPHEIEIYLPKDFTWIALAYGEIQVNPELENDLFDFIPPPSSEEGNIVKDLNP